MCLQPNEHVSVADLSRCLWPTGTAGPCVFSRAGTAGPCVFSRAGTAGPCVFRALCLSDPVFFGPCVFRTLCFSSPVSFDGSRRSDGVPAGLLPARRRSLGVLRRPRTRRGMCLSPTGTGGACVFRRPESAEHVSLADRSRCLSRRRIAGACVFGGFEAGVSGRPEPPGPVSLAGPEPPDPVSFEPCVFRTLCFSSLCLSVGVAVRMRLPPGCCPPRVASRCSSPPRSRGSVFRLRGVGRACVSGRTEHVSPADRGRRALCL